MSTNIRPETSKRNPWWIPKHRYYELKHFCLQYPDWIEECKNIDGLAKKSESTHVNLIEWADPTSTSVNMRELYYSNIRMVEECARIASNEIGMYILRAVTEELTYTHLKMMLNIPCSRGMFYDRYRKFFYILNLRK